MPQTLDLTTGPIPRHIARVAIPASVGYFFHTMYNVTDTYFGGLLSTQALAAMSLSFSMYLIMIAVGHGLSTGATALVGGALGKKDRPLAGTLGMQGIVFGVLVAAFATIGGLALSPWLFSILGAKGAYLAETRAYMDIILYGAVFFIVNYLISGMLNAQGDTKSFRNFLIIGFFVNIALDPWFVFGGWFLPPMGVAGVALATVAIEAIGTVYLFYRLKKSGLFSGCSLSCAFPQASHAASIAYQGFPAGISFGLMALGVFVIQYFVAWFGKDAIAAYGIGMRIEQVILIPTIGLNTAALAITAQNFGAGRFGRIRAALDKSLIYGAIITAFGSLALLLAADWAMGIFSDDPVVMDMGASYLRVDALALYAYIVLYLHVGMLQGMQRPLFAVFISFFRQIAAPIVVFYLFVRILDLDLLGVWWGIFSVTWAAALIAAFYARYTLKKMEKNLSHSNKTGTGGGNGQESRP